MLNSQLYENHENSSRFLTHYPVRYVALCPKNWQVDPIHAKVTFSTTHLGIADVTGLFKTFDVTATSDKADFSDAVFDLSVDVASINTEVDMRDNTLRSPEFFDVATFPKMTFKSTSIKKPVRTNTSLPVT